MTTMAPKSPPIFHFNEKLSLNDNINYDQQLLHLDSYSNAATGDISDYGKDNTTAMADEEDDATSLDDIKLIDFGLDLESSEYLLKTVIDETQEEEHNPIEDQFEKHDQQKLSLLTSSLSDIPNQFSVKEEPPQHVVDQPRIKIEENEMEAAAIKNDVNLYNTNLPSIVNGG